jgi:hypothetical protein
VKKQHKGRATSAGDSSQDFEVGYRKPPADTRFAKGRSGNPGGRPRGKSSTGLLEDVQNLAIGKISAREGDKIERITMQKALIRSLWHQALKGSVPATRKIFELIKEASLSEELAPPESELSPENREILKRYMERTEDNKKKPK